MKTIIEAVKSFIESNTKYIEEGNGLTVSLLTDNSLLIRGSKDERIGDWVENYQEDLAVFGKTNGANVDVIVEMSEELDSTAFVYVLISKKGDKSGMKKIKEIEKGRKGVYYFPISELPDLSDYTNYSALSRYLLEKSSEVIEVKEV